MKSLASNPISPQKCPVLGSRTALFFDWLKRKITKHINFLKSGIGVARNFDWGPQSANHMQFDVIKIFQKKEFFMGQKYLRMKDQKPGAWIVRKQDGSKGEGLEPKVNVFKRKERVPCSPIGDAFDFWPVDSFLFLI